MKRQPAVFLDKDGTLVEDVPYNVDPARMRLTARAVEGVRVLACAGYALVVVSNQSGVARGYFDASALDAVRVRLAEFIEGAGAELAGFYCCPHHPDGVVGKFARACDCRKPAPGLLRRAAQELRLDLGRSWMVGDTLDDIEAGQSAGCRTVLLDNGHETEWRGGALREPHERAPDLAGAARRILAAGAMLPPLPAGPFGGAL